MRLFSVQAKAPGHNYKEIIAMDPFSTSTFGGSIMLPAGFSGICMELYGT